MNNADRQVLIAQDRRHDVARGRIIIDADERNFTERIDATIDENRVILFNAGPKPFAFDRAEQEQAVDSATVDFFETAILQRGALVRIEEKHDLADIVELALQ